MPITLLDAILIVVMLVSAILAMIRGFSREVLSIVSWIVAAAAAFFFYKPVAPFVASLNAELEPASLVTEGLAAAAIFLATLLVVSFITMKVADFIIDSRIGPLDRTLGFMFGALRGALLVIVTLNFALWVFGDSPPAWVANAKSRPIMERIGDDIRQALPNDIGKLVPQREDAPAEAG